MKRLFLLAAMLFAPALCWAQQTTIQATVLDPTGRAYSFLTGTASINCPGNQAPLYNGFTVPRTIAITGADGNGHFSMVLYDINAITPVGCSYNFAITWQDAITTFIATGIGASGSATPITGAGPVNLSTPINAFAVLLPGSGGSVIGVTASSPIASSGGSTPNISCPTCTTNAAALTLDQLILGGGGQAIFALGSLGTTTTVLHGNAAGIPSFGAVNLATDVTGQLPIAAVGSAGLSGTSPISVASTGAISCSTCAITGSTSANIQTFTASGTWTQPVGAKTVTIVAIGGGGGGGGGGTGGNVGGGGGGGAAASTTTISAALLGGTETVTVGAGGAGGASGTTGGAGSPGTASSFGQWLQALGGGAGGANGAAGVAAQGNLGNFTQEPGTHNSGDGGAGNQNATPNLVPGQNGGGSAAGGGGGGNTNGAGVVGSNGGNGGSSHGSTLTGGAGGASAGGTGTNAVANEPFGGPGGGGGGGNNATSPGGTPTRYGGGGGGGGENSTGGTGAPGIVVVTTYF